MNVLERIRTGIDLDGMEFPPLTWAVPGLIPEGMGLLTGPPKAGKSWAVLDIALAIAGGGQALGTIPVGPARPVLYLALEDGERRLQGRCRHLLAEDPIPGRFHYLTAATPAEVMDVIRGWLHEHADERPVVILDTLGRVMPPSVPGESAYARDYRVGAHLKTTVDDVPGSTLLVVHHVRKAGSDDWMDSTSGTNGLNGAADFTVNLSRGRNESAGTLRVTGRDVPEGEYAVTHEDGRWQIDGTDLEEAAQRAEQDRATANLGDTSADVIRYVSEAAGPVSPKQVAEALGYPDATVRQYLRRSVEAGRLANPSRGRYTPVTSVTSVTSGGMHSADVTHVPDVTRTPGGVTERCVVCGDPIDGPALMGRCAQNHTDRRTA